MSVLGAGDPEGNGGIGDSCFGARYLYFRNDFKLISRILADESGNLKSGSFELLALCFPAAEAQNRRTFSNRVDIPARKGGAQRCGIRNRLF